MAVTLQLPVDTPYFETLCQLDGTLYQFTFRWNARNEQWTFDLADGAGDPVVSGIAVVVNFPLIYRPRPAGVPPGLLTAVDTSGRNVDPGLADLGPERRVQLVYSTRSEVEAVAARLAAGA